MKPVNGYAKKIKIKGIQEGWAWTERKWSKVTNDTGIGNPVKATKEKGEKYFKDVVDKVVTAYFRDSKCRCK